MKALLRSLALVGLLGVVGCENNPGAPAIDGTNKTGEDNTRKEGYKSGPANPKKGGSGATAPAPAKPD